MVDQASAQNEGMDPSFAKEKGQSSTQYLNDTPITFGLFGLLLASAVVAIIVRSTRSNRRVVSNDTFDGIPTEGVESMQGLLE